MAVRVNDRHTSDIEYENTFSQFNAYVSEKLKRVSKRYGRCLVRPFNEALNRTYKDIMEATDEYTEDKKQSVSRYRKCAVILHDMEILISVSYTFWNLSGGRNGIKYIRAGQREYWTAFVNKEVKLLAGVMAKCRKDRKLVVKIPVMKAYTKHDLGNAVFLQKLGELQRIIYTRAIQCGKDYHDAQIDMLVMLSRDALYNACEANRLDPGGGEDELKARTRYFSQSIGNLMAMNRPVRELAFCNIFTEKELGKICELSTECQKMMQAIKANDKQHVTA